MEITWKLCASILNGSRRGAPGLGMGAARSAQFRFAIGSALTRIKKNVSNMRQIKDTDRSCDDDQLRKF